MYKKIGKKIVRSYKKAKGTVSRVKQEVARSKRSVKAGIDWKRTKLIAEKKLNTRISSIKMRNPSISKKELKKELLKWNVRPSKGHTDYTLARRGTSFRKYTLKELRRQGFPKRYAKPLVVGEYKKMRRLGK